MLKRTLLIVLAGCGLTACVPALVAGGAAAGGSLAHDSRDLQVISDDQNISHQANSRLMSDKVLKTDARVTAYTFNHIVLLTGQTPTEAQRAHAEQLVQSVPRVRRIYNQITIGDPIGHITQSKDAMMTTNVKARMISTTDLKSNHFKVVTENGTVYLMGLTTRRQGDRAAEVARHSSGVKRVVKIIEYTN